MIAIVNLLSLVLTVWTWAIVIQAVLSWVRPDPSNYFVRLLNKITDPILRPIDRIIPPLGGISITPIVAILLLQLVQNALPTLLLSGGGY